MGRRSFVVLSILIALVFTQGAAGIAKSAGKRPYVIGAVFSTSGDNAPLGVPERDTVQMLVRQLNAAGGIKGHPVKVLFYDDAGKPEQAVQACQDLLANKDCLAVIGPTLTGPSLAIANMCNSAKMPLISCAASIKIVQPVKPFVFKTAQTDSLAIAKLIEYIKKARIKTIGFLNDSNAYGASGREQWLAMSKRAGIKTVETESFGTNDTNMTSQLTKIRAAKPQAILCWGTNPGPAIVAKNMRALGMKQPLLMSHGIANMDFIKLAGRSADGVIFPAGKLTVAKSIPSGDPQKSRLLKYSADVMKAYGKPANSFGGYAYDSLTLVTNAIRTVGPNRTKIRDYVEKTNHFVGISGVFNFSSREHNGLTKDAFALVVIKNGKWVLIK